MTARRIPALPTNKIVDLLFRNVQHAHSGDLRSTAECHICNEPFLTGCHPERPVILRCGHILGEGCILKWISPLSWDGGRNSCPLCRGKLLDLSAVEVPTAHRTQSGDSERSGFRYLSKIWIALRTLLREILREILRIEWRNILITLGQFLIVCFTIALLLVFFLIKMDDWSRPNPTRPLEFRPSPPLYR